MKDRIAAAISVVFSPFLVPIATVVVVAHRYATSANQAFLWIVIVTTFFSVLPVFFILILFRFRRVSSLNLVVQEQRTWSRVHRCGYFILHRRTTGDYLGRDCVRRKRVYIYCDYADLENQLSYWCRRGLYHRARVHYSCGARVALPIATNHCMGTGSTQKAHSFSNYCWRITCDTQHGCSSSVNLTHLSVRRRPLLPNCCPNVSKYGWCLLTSDLTARREAEMEAYNSTTE